MRTRSLLVPPLAAAALLLSACTSASTPESAEATTQDPAPSTASDVGVAQPAPANGYLCRYLSLDNQRGVTGAAWSEPLQVTVEDSVDTWECQARDGEEPLVRVAIYRGEELPAQQRVAAREAGLQRSGPPHLGEAYLGDRQVTSLTMCKILDSEGSRTYEPYSLVVEALSEDDTDVRRDLTVVASAMARSLDQAVGCSPRLAAEQAPDDAAATTAP